MKPILFNTEMVRAILDGRKTVTRRIIDIDIVNNCDKESDGTLLDYQNCCGDFIEPTRLCRYKVGDILYVRETFANTWRPDSEDIGFVYKADGIPQKFPYWGNVQYKEEVWIPSIHMPKEAARIFLKVTNVRVERLQDITEQQVVNEGIKSYWAEPHTDTPPFIGIDLCHTRIKAFKQLWNSTIKKQDIGKYDWSSNPYVWVIEFERVDKPND